MSFKTVVRFIQYNYKRYQFRLERLETKPPVSKSLLQGCQPATSSNIENMIGSQEDDRWRHNARHIDVILVDCDVSFKKKKHKTTPNVQYRIPYRGRGGEESEGNIKLSNLPKRFDTIPDDQRLCCFPTTPKVSDIRLKVDNYQWCQSWFFKLKFRSSNSLYKTLLLILPPFPLPIQAIIAHHKHVVLYKHVLQCMQIGQIYLSTKRFYVSKD